MRRIWTHATEEEPVSTDWSFLFQSLMMKMVGLCAYEVVALGE